MSKIKNIYFIYTIFFSIIQAEEVIYMLKEQICKEGILYENIVGYYLFEGYDGELSSPICVSENMNEINDLEYYYTEFFSETSESDYHTFVQKYRFKGIYMTFRLNNLDLSKYFEGIKIDYKNFNDQLIAFVKNILTENGMLNKDDNVYISDGRLNIVLLNKNLDNNIRDVGSKILHAIRDSLDASGFHITRMFGSYILLMKNANKLKAVAATPIPIKYCPLMKKLLEEVGGDNAKKLIECLGKSDLRKQTKEMCNLINEVVIESGYFDTNRPLNSCEANVLFGASETMSSAFKTGLIDAAVIVSNNLGTIITTNEFNTQGAVKRMTGLFHTSPNKTILERAKEAGIIPVFPYTAIIDQLEGVKKAISLGYKKIAVSVAAQDNKLHRELERLEKENNIKIYKFGLCSTGIDYATAISMRDYADVVWSCASKYVKSEIAPNAILQVGVKIPVYIMTEKGFEIVKNHLQLMNGGESLSDEDIKSQESVIINSKDGLKVLKKNNIHNCSDCPYPCV